MLYKGQNFSGVQPKLKDGDELVSCNLAQDQPHTKVAEGVRNLSFTACNLVNCDLPPDAAIKDCLQVQVLTTVVPPTPILGGDGQRLDQAGVDALIADYRTAIELYEQKIQSLQPRTIREVVE